MRLRMRKKVSVAPNMMKGAALIAQEAVAFVEKLSPRLIVVYAAASPHQTTSCVHGFTRNLNFAVRGPPLRAMQPSRSSRNFRMSFLSAGSVRSYLLSSGVSSVTWSKMRFA
jgi:hypothetical protein